MLLRHARLDAPNATELDGSTPLSTPAPDVNMTEVTPPPFTPPAPNGTGSFGIDGKMASASEEASYASVLAKQAEQFAREYTEAKKTAAQYAKEVVEAAEVVRRESRAAANASDSTADAVTVVNGDAGFIDEANITATAAVATEAAESAQHAAERVTRALAAFRASEEDAKRAAAKGLGVAKVINASIDRTLQYSHESAADLEAPAEAAKKAIVASTTLIASSTTTTAVPTTTTASLTSTNLTLEVSTPPSDKSSSQRLEVHASRAVILALGLSAASVVAGGCPAA